MSIGGPGNIGGPKGPGGPSQIDGPGGVGDVGDVGDVSDVGGAGEAGSVTPSDLDALAADLKAGTLTPREAIDKLVAEAGAGLPQAEQAELREMLTDLVANDPYLQSLANRL